MGWTGISFTMRKYRCGVTSILTESGFKNSSMVACYNLYNTTVIITLNSIL